MKISIVTPSFNSAKYIESTIQSVLSQAGNFEIEYIIIDNLSTDGTGEIVGKYQKALEKGTYLLCCRKIELTVISEPDSGMYDAVNKGFNKATGDIYSWINADDIYMPGAFAAITAIFEQLQDINWITGRSCVLSENGIICSVLQPYFYIRSWIDRGVYGRDRHFIDQASVFWRSWLWSKSGGINPDLKLAGDYDLWLKFSKHASLVTTNALASGFRIVPGQLSEDRVTYMKEVEEILPRKGLLPVMAKFFSRAEKRIHLTFFKSLIFYLLFQNIQHTYIVVRRNGSLEKITGPYHTIFKMDKIVLRN